jgi:ABC-2 type transport system permease protein
MFIFSFIGLCITYLGSRKNSNSSIINLINYFVLFSSDVFYPTSSFNKTIATIGNMLPLNPILTILRGEGFRWELIFWVIIPIIVFLFMLKIIKFSR